jgi:glycosyltransferase involved in cell wall biosynthesis
MTSALYVSQTGLSEPLGRSQIVPYVKGLAAAGHRIEVVGMEPHNAADADIAAVTADLATVGVGYDWARRSPSHSLAVKLRESTAALVRLLARAASVRPRLVHARSYMPGAVALALTSLWPRARFLFDCRGLLGDEYVDFGHWTRESLNFRLIKRAEKLLFGRADAVVTLTARLRDWLRDESHLVGAGTPVEVIPCCVDLEHFRASDDTRAKGRRALGLAPSDERFVLAYAGTLKSFYCEPQMADFYAALRRRRPSLFAVYTRADAAPLKKLLAERGVPEAEVVVRAVGFDEMPGALSAADGAVCFIEPQFSKIASSPTKLGEYLAVGLPVAMNRGVGDSDAILDEAAAGNAPVAVDAGRLSLDSIEAAAAQLAALPPSRARARALADAHFSLTSVGVARYAKLYEALS